MTTETTKSRAEHLAWCKERALEALDQSGPQEAWKSMVSDLMKHPETMGDFGIELGMALMMGGHLKTNADMRHHIEGFT